MAGAAIAVVCRRRRGFRRGAFHRSGGRRSPSASLAREESALRRCCALQPLPRHRRTLIRVREHPPLPHLREQAAARLKVADGWSMRHEARLGLLRPHSRNTVNAWVARWRARGLARRTVRAGRGRKPAFSPYEPQPGPPPTDRPAATPSPFAAPVGEPTREADAAVTAADVGVVDQPRREGLA
jgi:hypothetical protein